MPFRNESQPCNILVSYYKYSTNATFDRPRNSTRPGVENLAMSTLIVPSCEITGRFRPPTGGAPGKWGRVNLFRSPIRAGPRHWPAETRFGRTTHTQLAE